MPMKSALFPFLLAFLTIASASAMANAETAGTSFSVSVMVLPYCSTTASPMRFGNPAGAQVNGTSTVSTTCNSTEQTPYNVGMSAGIAPGAAAASKIMIGPGSAVIGYAPQSNLLGLVNLGHPVSVETTAPNGFSSQTLSIPGQIPAGERALGGASADIITVTITY